MDLRLGKNRKAQDLQYYLEPRTLAGEVDAECKPGRNVWKQSLPSS